MKNITIAGNIGKDAVLRTTQNGDKVASFSVAVEDRIGREKQTVWFDVALWGERGESLSQYLTRGSKVVVTGDLTTRKHDGKTYLGVRANDVTLMGGGQDRRDDRHDDTPPKSQTGYGGGGRKSNADIDDEIPF